MKAIKSPNFAAGIRNPKIDEISPEIREKKNKKRITVICIQGHRKDVTNSNVHDKRRQHTFCKQLLATIAAIKTQVHLIFLSFKKADGLF
jgi:hypothetical protein